MKKPSRASIDEVRITRKDHAATIKYADPTVSTVQLTIGPQIGSMSDSDIIDLLNATIEAQDRLASEYDHTLIVGCSLAHGRKATWSLAWGNHLPERA
jgi:hypothetical protein